MSRYLRFLLHSLVYFSIVLNISLWFIERKTKSNRRSWRLILVGVGIVWCLNYILVYGTSLFGSHQELPISEYIIYFCLLAGTIVAAVTVRKYRNSKD